MASARTVVSKEGRRGKGMYVCCAKCGKQGGIRPYLKPVVEGEKVTQVTAFEVTTLKKVGKEYQCLGGCVK